MTGSSDGLCPFCSGLAIDSEKPIPETEFTCGNLSGFAKFMKDGTEDCSEMMLAEALCCSSPSADESDLGESDQEVEQSSPSDASEDEDAADTGEQSDAPDLWTVSPAIIHCAAFIAYVYL